MKRKNVSLLLVLMTMALTHTLTAQAQQGNFTKAAKVYDVKSINAFEAMYAKKDGTVLLFGGITQLYVYNNLAGLLVSPTPHNAVKIQGNTWSPNGTASGGADNVTYAADVQGVTWIKMEGVHAFMKQNPSTGNYDVIPKVLVAAGNFYDWGGNIIFSPSYIYDSITKQTANGSCLWDRKNHTITSVVDSKGKSLSFSPKTSTFTADSTLVFSPSFTNSIWSIKRGETLVDEKKYPNLPETGLVEYVASINNGLYVEQTVTVNANSLYKVYKSVSKIVAGVLTYSWSLVFTAVPIDAVNNNDPFAGIVEGKDPNTIGAIGAWNMVNGKPSNGTLWFNESTGAFGDLAPLPLIGMSPASIYMFVQLNGIYYMFSRRSPDNDFGWQGVWVLDNSVLPIKLSSFSAQNAGKSNLLLWSTSNEINSKEFDIEKSAYGIHFSQIGTVITENAINGADYKFYDNNPTPGMNYYKLKMVDKDGRFDYSNTVVITNTVGVDVTVYPNPTSRYVVIDHVTDGNVIQLFSLDGKQLITPIKVAGNTSQQIPLDRYAGGIYLVTVSGTGPTASKITFKVVKQ